MKPLTTLTGFLLDRFDEDEAATLTMVCECVDDPGPGCPARVLAECEAKRRIIEQVSDVGWGGYAVRDVILELLALPYVEDQDFDPAWAL